MTNINRILGRPRVEEQLSRVEIAALEKDAAPPKPPVNQENVKVKSSAITWRWTLVCPQCGFKVSGQGTPKPGDRLSKPKPRWDVHLEDERERRQTMIGLRSGELCSGISTAY